MISLVKLPSPDRLETIRILHVDDEPDLLQITKLYLTEANPAFTIESLSTPNNAMEKLEEPFDCVVSDYQMPGMDGIELCRRIKEKHDIPFIIYTGRGSEEVASIAFEAGADDYIRKEAEPGHYQVLARRIEEAVRKHRVERELQLSESRYRKLVELSPFAILTYDFKGFVTSVNRTLLDLTGYSESELVGKHFTKLGYLRVSDAPRYLKIFGSLLKGEIPPPVEFPYLTKGGEPKWAEAHVAFLEDEENRRIGILSVVRDITERKRNEDTLDAIFRSGSRLADLDNSEEVYSATLQILHETLGFQTFGIAVQTGQGFRYITSIFDTLSEGFLIPLDQPSIVRRAFNTGVTQLVPDTRLDPDYYTLPDRDRESLRLSDLVVPIIVDGEVVAVIDIESKEANFFTRSYRRFAEILALHVASAISRLSQLDLLRESEKYRTFVESSMDAVYVVQEGGIVYTNKVGAELLGYSDPSDVIGIDPLDLVPPEHRGELDERLARTWRGEEDSGRYEMQILRKDGSRLDIDTSSANILYEGKPARLAFDRDITERKRMEEERIENHKRIIAIHQHSMALAQANDLKEVAERTFEVIEDVMGYRIGSFGQVDSLNQRVIYVQGLEPEELYPIDGPGITNRAIRTGLTQRIADTRSDDGYLSLTDESHPTLSELDVPVLIDGEVVALINLESEKLDAFTLQDQTLVEILAKHVASAMSRLKHSKALIESEEKYRTILESSMEAVSIISDAHMVYVNDHFLKLFGYDSRGEVLGRVSLDFVAPGDLDKIREKLRLRGSGDDSPFRYEYEALRKNGTTLDCEVQTTLIDLEGKKAILGFTRDISERKRMEEELMRYADRLEELVAEKISELSESEEMFKTIFVESPIGIEIYDAEGRLLTVNEACLNIFGIHDVNAVRGFKLFEDPNIPEDMKQRLLQRESVRYLASFDFDKVRELGLYDTKKSGSILTDVGITPLSGEGSENPAGYLVLVQDITEQKRMEEELIDASKMLAAGSIASMLGHDLRGPLMLIKNALYLMEKRPESAEKSREIISNAVDHASEMLEELRSSTRDTPLRLVATNLENLFGQVVEDVSIPLQVTLAIDVGEGLERTLLDPAKMRRVLGNLLLNAVEAMPEGGELTVSGEIEGGDVVISVRDTGKGIPVEEMPDLFKPFVTTKSKGMGLGLPYCKRAVEAHGGSISVESEVGVGSMFMVRLPLDPKT